MERIKRIQILDQKLQIPFNSLKDLTSIKQEIKDIAATEEAQPFNITEFELLSGVIFSLTTKIFDFLTDINSGQKQVDDVDLAELEKILKELPEKTAATEVMAQILEANGKNAAAFAQRSLVKTMQASYKQALADAIQKEKVRRQNSPDVPNFPSKNDEPDDKNDDPNKNDSPNDNKNPPVDNSQKITNLQSQIDALEEKLRNQPSSDSSSTDKKKLERLRAEIEELKKKPKGNSQTGGNDNENKKDDFPWGIVIGLGALVFVLLVVIIILFNKNRKNN